MSTPRLPPLRKSEFKAWLGKLPYDRLFGRADPCYCPIACFLREKKGVLRPVVVNDVLDRATDQHRALPKWADDFITVFDKLPSPTPQARAAYKLLCD